MTHNYTAPSIALISILIFGAALALFPPKSTYTPEPARASPAKPTVISALAAISAAAKHPDARQQSKNVRGAALRLIAALSHTGRCAKQQGWLLAKVSTAPFVGVEQVKEWVTIAKARGCTALTSLPWKASNSQK